MQALARLRSLALPGSDRFSGLGVRLLLIILLALVPMVMLVLYNALQDRRDANSRVHRQAQAQFTRTVGRQELLLEGARTLMASLSGLTGGGSVGSFNQEGCRTTIRALLAQVTYYSNLGVALPNGNVVCSVAAPTDTPNVSDTDWFKRVSRSGRFAVGTFQNDPVIGEPDLNLGYPVYGSDGVLRAMIFLTVSDQWFSQLTADQSATSAFTLFDSNGTVVVDRRGASGASGTAAQDAPDFIAAKKTHGNDVQTLKGLDGFTRLYAVGPVGDPTVNGLYATVGVNQRQAYAAVNSTLRQNLLILAAVGAVALLATLLANHYLIARPIRRLIDLTQRLSAGDLSARAGFKDHGDEFSTLGQAFDVMSSNLEQRTAEQAEIEGQLLIANARMEQTVADLRRSNTDLEQFAYVASHDLQEPLRMVSSYTQLLSRRYKDKLDSDADDFIGFAVDGAQRMQSLISDLLSFSRVGTRATALGPVDMEKVFKQAVTNLTIPIEEKHAVITHDPLPLVSGDEIQLTQVLQNLIGNALKFQGAEAPQIHVGAKYERTSTEFSVSDNGIGIAAEHRDRIFVIFQRLHARTEYPGTGIGLAITKRIVERHGGRIWVESTEGEGTTFYFTLLSPSHDVERYAGSINSGGNHA